MSHPIEKNLVAETPKIEKLPISVVRETLTKLVDRVISNPNQVIEVHRRKSPSAYLVSTTYAPIIKGVQTGNMKTILTNLILNNWLGTKNVPEHLKGPQLKELESMTLGKLLALYQADPDKSLKSLMKLVGLENSDKSLVERLIKRRKMLMAIASAEDENLYEVAEHLSGTT